MVRTKQESSQKQSLKKMYHKVKYCQVMRESTLYIANGTWHRG
jgi:hypothetical protein